MHFVMIFIDGLGLGLKEKNPVISAFTPNLDRLLGGQELIDKGTVYYKRAVMYSIDACLGVEGIPQSATGQTTLWTGVNAAEAIGCHLNAYPNERLIEIIKSHSIFKQLKNKGKRIAFANAFSANYQELISQGLRKHSASTLCALAGGITLRTGNDLIAGKAVYQDITNETMRKRGENVPIFSPYQAGVNLGKLMLEYDFTLFEFFQTDILGHKLDYEKAVEIIELLDIFLGGFFEVIEAVDSGDQRIAFMLTSDHGNIEDLSTREHTFNKVPAICWANFDIEFPNLKSLQDITPAVVELLTKN